jgi:hypothetical protein
MEGKDADSLRYAFANNDMEIYDEFLTFGLAQPNGQLITFTGSALGSVLPNFSQSVLSKRSFEKAKNHPIFP